LGAALAAPARLDAEGGGGGFDVGPDAGALEEGGGGGPLAGGGVVEAGAANAVGAGSGVEGAFYTLN